MIFTLLMVLRTLLLVLRTLFLVLRTVWLDKPIRFLKPYRFWLIGVWFLLKGIWLWLDVVLVLFIHPVLRTPLKRGILDGVLVLLGVCGFWLAADMA
jgi:hypothetical protein